MHILTVFPFTHSVARELEAIAEPHPKVLNFASIIFPSSSTCTVENELIKCVPALQYSPGETDIYLDLELHNISTGWSADQSGANVRIAFIQGTDVSRILVVIDNLKLNEGEYYLKG